MSAVFFQDPFGLVTFDEGFRNLGGVRPRTGKSHIVHCLDAYQTQRGLQSVRRVGDLSTTIGGLPPDARSMLPVVSDFLFDECYDVVRELVAPERDARRLPRPDR